MATPSTTPVANPDTATTTDAAAVTANVLANDVDPDSTETLTLTGAAIASGQGTVSIVSGKLVYDPGTAYLGLDAGQSATVSIGYTIADKKGLTAGSTLSVTVNGVNEAPTATGARLQGTSDTQVVSAATLLAGAHDPEGQALAVASVSGATHGTATLNADGSVTFQRQPGFGGTASFGYSVSDGHGGTAYATAQVGYQAAAAAGEPAGAIRTVAAGTILDAVLTPDSQSLIVDRADGSITQYSLVTGAQTASWKSASLITAIDVSLDGKYLLAVGNNAAGGTGNFNPFTERLDLTTGAMIVSAAPQFHALFYDELAATADGKAVLAKSQGTSSETLSTYDPAGGSGGSQSGSVSATSVTLTRSADGNRTLLDATYGASGTLIEYGPNLTKIGEVDSSVAGTSIAAVANGGAFAAQVTNGVFLYDSQLHLLANLAFINPDVAGLDKASYAGLAFSPDGSALYALDVTGDQVIKFSTSDYSVQALLPVGVDLTSTAITYGDRLEISADGHYLSVIADTGVQLLDLSAIQSLPVPSQPILGTAGDDHIEGTSGNDSIHALAGNDVVNGNGGDDQIDGGDGNDTLSGGAGNDTLSDSASGSDTLIGGDGNDTLSISHTQWNGTGARPSEMLVLQGGDGNDVVSVNSYATGTVSVDLGAGNDTFTLGVSYATSLVVTTGAGRDVVDPGSWNVLEPAIEVTDFTPGDAGDVFRVSALSGFPAGGNPFATGNLLLVQQGSTAVLDEKSGNTLTAVARFDNTQASQFTAANFGGYAPVAVNVADLATVSVLAPAVVTEGIGSSFTPVLAFRNATSGTSVTVTLDSHSTATNGSDIAASNFSGTVTATQATNGVYVANLPAISYGDDAVAEGAETIVLRVTAAGQLFANGTDTTLVTVTLADHGSTGTDGDDVIAGTSYNDVLSGLGGNDQFTGSAGSDRIDGGTGHNVLTYDALFRQDGVSATGGAVTVVKSNGTDSIVGVQDIAFHDGHFITDPASPGAQLTRMYDTVFGRAPDAGGFDYWLHRMEGGTSLNAVANEFTNSAEFQQATGTLSNAAFVDYLYQHALGRAPDADGHSYWTGQLDAGMSRLDLLVGFSESGEHQARTATLVGQGYFDTDVSYQGVTLIYDAALGRLPDAGGLVYWGDQVKSGAQTLGQVAQASATSAEFTQDTAGMSNAQLVTYMYQNSLHRAPDAGGLAFWTDQLDHGLSKGDFILESAQSAEHVALMASHIVSGIG